MAETQHSRRTIIAVEALSAAGATYPAYLLSDELLSGPAHDLLIFTAFGALFITFHQALRGLLLGHERGWLEKVSGVATARGLVVSTVVGGVGGMLTISVMAVVWPWERSRAVEELIPVFDIDTNVVFFATGLWLTYKLTQVAISRLAGRFGGDESPEVTTA